MLAEGVVVWEGGEGVGHLNVPQVEGRGRGYWGYCCYCCYIFINISYCILFIYLFKKALNKICTLISLCKYFVFNPMTNKDSNSIRDL